MDINNLIKKLNLLDWTVSLGALSYGVYAQDLFWIVGGLIGLVIAYFQPVKFIQKKLGQKFLSKKKKDVHDSHAEGLYFPAVVGKAVNSVETTSPTVRRDYRQSPYQVSAIVLTPSKHNHLRLEAVHGTVPKKRTSF